MTHPSRGTGVIPASVAVSLMALVLLGCSGDKTAPAKNDSGVPGDATTAGGASATSGGNRSGTTVGLVRDSRTRWINDIPYDVWFDRPQEVYQDNTPLVAATTGNTAVVTPESSPVEPETTSLGPGPVAATAGGGDDGGAVNWDELAPADMLVAEVKELRVRLSANLQTVATFNRATDNPATDPIANDSMVLSALAGVVERTTHEVSWRDKAKNVRDLAYQVSTVSGSGREAFQKAKDPYDKIVTILDGGPPPDKEAADKTPFADYVSRGEMMKRISTSLDWLKAEVNTESRLKEYQEQVARTATLLGVLGAVCGDSGYEFAEEPEYQDFVRSFVAANAELAQSASGQNFAEFEAARGRLQNTCAACHTKYKDTGS